MTAGLKELFRPFPRERLTEADDGLREVNGGPTKSVLIKNAYSCLRLRRGDQQTPSFEGVRPSKEVLWDAQVVKRKCPRLILPFAGTSNLNTQVQACQGENTASGWPC